MIANNNNITHSSTRCDFRTARDPMLAERPLDWPDSLHCWARNDYCDDGK